MIGNNIKDILASKQLKIGEFADKLGISRTYLSYVINDKRKPSFELLEQMADVLDVPISELVKENNLSEIDKTQRDIELLVRMAEKLTPEQRQKMADVAKAMFPEIFKK